MPRDREQELRIAAEFGQRVKQLRTEADLTQEELAEKVGMHPTFISNLERGYRVPSLPTVLRVADGLDRSATEIIGHILL